MQYSSFTNFLLKHKYRIKEWQFYKKNTSFENVANFPYFLTILINRRCLHQETGIRTHSRKCLLRLNLGFLSSLLIPNNVYTGIEKKNKISPGVLYGREIS